MPLERLRALSVKQPWAMAICHGKDVENRSHRTRRRGPVAIHASQKFDDIPFSTLAWILERTGLTREQAVRFDHRGAVVAVADIVGCHECPQGRQCSPWAVAGQWHWDLSNVHVLATPVPCRGQLGMWWLPEHVHAAVAAQIDPK
jgi:hypothetical protein